MAKQATYPTLYNEVLSIDISTLKRLGLLKHEQVKSDVLNWSKNGNKVASISILVNTFSEQPYIEIDYNYKGEVRNYTIPLVYTISHLDNRSRIWYFLCPKTNKRCKKLYCISGYFYHREAFSGCMYETQIKSKVWRQMFKSLIQIDNLLKQTERKHFKETYAGKYTKKYLRIMQKLHKLEQANECSLLHL